MSDTIEYPNIFKVLFNGNAFTSILISNKGFLLTVAHPFTDNLTEETSMEIENKKIKLKTRLFYKPKGNEPDFAILKITEKHNDLPEPFKLNKIMPKDNQEVYGYGYGKAVAKVKSGKFDLHLKYGGRLNADLLFGKDSNYRHVTFGDSGGPMFMNNDFNQVIGINYQRDYSKIENKGYFSGYLLPVSHILSHLYGLNTDDKELKNLIREIDRLDEQKDVLEEILKIQKNSIELNMQELHKNLKNLLSKNQFNEIFIFLRTNNNIFKDYKNFEEEFSFENYDGIKLKRFKERLETYIDSCLL